jgi:hypothetical protein
MLSLRVVALVVSATVVVAVLVDIGRRLPVSRLVVGLALKARFCLPVLIR